MRTGSRRRSWRAERALLVPAPVDADRGRSPCGSPSVSSGPAVILGRWHDKNAGFAPPMCTPRRRDRHAGDRRAASVAEDGVDAGLGVVQSPHGTSCSQRRLRRVLRQGGGAGFARYRMYVFRPGHSPSARFSHPGVARPAAHQLLRLSGCAPSRRHQQLERGAGSKCAAIVRWLRRGARILGQRRWPWEPG